MTKPPTQPEPGIHLDVPLSRRTPKPLRERFSEKYRVGDNGCWLWTAFTFPNGYGQFSSGRKHFYAHRASYCLFIGKIPETFDVHHTCETPSCVNPEHLVALDRKTHLRLGKCPSAINARKTHCIRGHPLSGENLYFHPDRKYRACKQCDKDRKKLARKRRRSRCCA